MASARAPGAPNRVQYSAGRRIGETVPQADSIGQVRPTSWRRGLRLRRLRLRRLRRFRRRWPLACGRFGGAAGPDAVELGAAAALRTIDERGVLLRGLRRALIAAPSHAQRIVAAGIALLDDLAAGQRPAARGSRADRRLHLRDAPGREQPCECASPHARTISPVVGDEVALSRVRNRGWASHSPASTPHLVGGLPRWRAAAVRVALIQSASLPAPAAASHSSRSSAVTRTLIW